MLGSSDRGGIRIQYSKNPFGRREPGASSPGLASGVNPLGSPMTESLAASLNTSQNSPRVSGLGGAGLLSSLNGSAASSAGGAAVVTGTLPPVLVGQAGLEQILHGDM